MRELFNCFPCLCQNLCCRGIFYSGASDLMCSCLLGVLMAIAAGAGVIKIIAFYQFEQLKLPTCLFLLLPIAHQFYHCFTMGYT